MKNKKYHTVGTILKYNPTNRGKKADINRYPSIHISDRSLSWLRTDTPIKSYIG